jgi:hypothetical protein
MTRKNFNAKKEQYRGTIKQIMKVRGLRSINIFNYSIWNGGVNEIINNVHSIKMDIQDGYLNVFAKGNGVVAGRIIDNVSGETYKALFDTVLDIISKEDEIPGSLRRNILVKVSR